MPIPVDAPAAGGSSGFRLLLVEDDRELSGLLATLLSEEGYLVDVARDGQRGLHLAITGQYDLLVVDRGLPAIEGVDLVRRLRKQGVMAPILVLTARGTVGDRIEGLDAGAEDYLIKPFDVDELLARLRALRRRHSDDAPALSLGTRHLIVGERRVTGGSEPDVLLSQRECGLLEILARRPRQVFSREELLGRAFGDADTTGSVDTYVHYVRRKLGREVIRTIRGSGLPDGLGVTVPGLGAVQPGAPVGPAGDDARLLRRAAMSIAVQVAAAVSVVVLTMIVAVLIVDEHQQHAEANRSSRRAWASADDVSDPPANVSLVIARAGGDRQVSPEAPSGVDAVNPVTLADGPTRLNRGGRELVAWTGDRTVGRVSAVYDLSPREAEEKRLLISLAIASLLGVLGATAIGLAIGRRAVRPLGTAMALQRRFVADASHELRTPLTVLQLRAQLLQRHLSTRVSPERQDDLERLVQDAKVMGDVVNELLVSAELGHRPATGEPVDLGVLAVQVVDALQPMADEREIHLRKGEDAPATDVLVNGSPAALRRAISSLVDNALAHTPPGGHVWVRAHRAGREVEVTVRDDGQGIDPGETDRLLERFARGTGHDQGRRFGLGLALVNEVARSHSGVLKVEGALGRGAAFTLVLPAARR